MRQINVRRRAECLSSRGLPRDALSASFVREKLKTDSACARQGVPETRLRTASVMERSSTAPVAALGSSGVYTKKLRGETMVTSYQPSPAQAHPGTCPPASHSLTALHGLAWPCAVHV